MMTQLLIFAVFSVVLIAVSWRALRDAGSHGFYRFFAWETILGLFVLYAPAWFDEPLAWHQIVSWILLTVCIVPLIYGVRALRGQGKPAAQRGGEPALLGFEKTTRLVTTSIYKYIRHPLYASLLFLTWGIFFKSPAWMGGLLAIAATGLLIATAKADEKECTRFFGDEYRRYMQRSKMFIPYIL